MPVLREWERQGTGKSGERCRVGKLTDARGPCRRSAASFTVMGRWYRRASIQPQCLCWLHLGAGGRCGLQAWTRRREVVHALGT